MTAALGSSLGPREKRAAEANRVYRSTIDMASTKQHPATHRRELTSMGSVLTEPHGCRSEPIRSMRSPMDEASAVRTLPRRRNPGPTEGAKGVLVQGRGGW